MSKERHSSKPAEDPKSGTSVAKVKAARLSVISNTLLTGLKLVVGLISGSVSVLSEAVHSATDLLASWIAFFSVRVADQPADEDHPYGHGKVESLSGLAEALLIFLAATYIIYEAIHKLIAKEAPQRLDLGIIVMIVSAGANSLIARYLFRVAEETDSLALHADGEHLRTDVYTSLGVLLGLILVHATGWTALDPIAAIIVALLIFAAAWRLSHGAVMPLLDAQLPAEDIDTVRKVLDGEPAVLGYHKLRTRKSGSYRYVDAHIMLEDNLTLLAAHDLTEKLEDRIRESMPNVEITLHTEPYDAELRHQYEQHGGPYPDEKASG